MIEGRVGDSTEASMSIECVTNPSSTGEPEGMHRLEIVSMTLGIRAGEDSVRDWM
jgi:hypothetical protein